MSFLPETILERLFKHAKQRPYYLEYPTLAGLSRTFTGQLLGQ